MGGIFGSLNKISYHLECGGYMKDNIDDEKLDVIDGIKAYTYLEV